FTSAAAGTRRRNDVVGPPARARTRARPRTPPPAETASETRVAVRGAPQPQCAIAFQRQPVAFAPGQLREPLREVPDHRVRRRRLVLALDAQVALVVDVVNEIERPPVRLVRRVRHRWLVR